ncbi:hypothetical protein [Pseudomonas sp. SJZ131]|uniref:hypothetical protein n=1 Tax=Pseudomonas sp. SJZ131 TaxID=2572895 RepID=UPI00119D4D41|nr:hypothetical protein [Pseudomonas sp. SJZ131]
MYSWKRFIIALGISLSAFLLFAYSIAGMPENPNDLTDTSGVPAAYMFAIFTMVFGICSWGVSLIGLLVGKVVSDDRTKLQTFIFCIGNLPLFLTSAFGVFSVAAFSYDSIIGILGGILFFSIMVFFSLLLLPASRVKRKLM